MNSRSKKFTKDVTPSKPPSRRRDANDALAMVLKGKWGRIYDYPCQCLSMCTLKQSSTLFLSWNYDWLVVTGTMEFYEFPSYWEWKIIPTDFHSIIFQRGRLNMAQPPTRYILTRESAMHCDPQRSQLGIRGEWLGRSAEDDGKANEGQTKKTATKWLSKQMKTAEKNMLQS